jgi:hypothetical protein
MMEIIFLKIAAMTQTFRQQALVKSQGRIEIQDDRLPEGKTVSSDITNLFKKLFGLTSVKLLEK